jgi:ribosomal protein L11 methyltransferase
MLETIVERARPVRALDLGTGSGILAIAAARLGVPEILAIDSDPDAVASATANVERNGLARRITCVMDDASGLSAAPAPLVLANLLAAAHRALAPVYARLVCAGGTLVAGGCLDGEADDVTTVLDGYAFRRQAARSIDGWTTLAYEHAPLRDRA